MTAVRLFRSLAITLRQRAGKRRLRRQFEHDWKQACDSFHGWKPWCACSKQDGEKLRKRLFRLPAELEADLRRSRKGELETFNSALRKISAHAEQFAGIADRDLGWRSSATSLSASVNEVWKASSIFPGRDFARDVDARKRNIGAILKEIPTQTQPEKLNQKLDLAGRQVAALRRLVDEAGEAVTGAPVLMESIAKIGGMGIERDVDTARAYQTLIRMETALQLSIGKNSYTAAYRLLTEARDLCAAIRRDIEERHDLARREINLWLDDAEISGKFRLEIFPDVLTPEWAQRWQDIRLEIRDLVAERAEKARRAYSLLTPAERNLQFSFKQLGDWENLEAFAYAARTHSP